jgi:hypothetical protein
MCRLPDSDPTVEELYALLHAAGWSIGEVAPGDAWTVTGTNGENVIHAGGETCAEAWRLAVEQARAVGMVRGLEGRPGRIGENTDPYTGRRSGVVARPS